jgi:hypothetical protein
MFTEAARGPWAFAGTIRHITMHMRTYDPHHATCTLQGLKSVDRLTYLSECAGDTKYEPVIVVREKFKVQTCYRDYNIHPCSQ